MVLCIGLCVLGIVAVVMLYSALIIASHEDDLVEEYFQKNLKEEIE